VGRDLAEVGGAVGEAEADDVELPLPRKRQKATTSPGSTRKQKARPACTAPDGYRSLRNASIVSPASRTIPPIV
jgi:hypothetical protein